MSHLKKIRQFTGYQSPNLQLKWVTGERFNESEYNLLDITSNMGLRVKADSPYNFECFDTAGTTTYGAYCKISSNAPRYSFCVKADQKVNALIVQRAG